MREHQWRGILPKDYLLFYAQAYQPMSRQVHERSAKNAVYRAEVGSNRHFRNRKRPPINSYGASGLLVSKTFWANFTSPGSQLSTSFKLLPPGTHSLSTLPSVLDSFLIMTATTDFFDNGRTQVNGEHLKLLSRFFDVIITTGKGAYQSCHFCLSTNSIGYLR